MGHFADTNTDESKYRQDVNFIIFDINTIVYI